MEKISPEIKVLFDKNLLRHEFLKFIADDERDKIQSRLERGSSVCCGFIHDENLLFVTVFDFESGCLHVRVVGGFFLRKYEILDKFTEGFAKYLGMDFITFKTERDAVNRVAESAGYEHNDETGEMQRMVTPQVSHGVH